MKHIDPKVRFQDSKFKNQLQKARSYKRNPKIITDKELETLLDKIGLGSLWAKLGLGAAIAALIYVIYIPNPWFIRNVTVQGLPEEQAGAVQTTIGNYMSDNLAWPQKNILLLSKARLQAYLTDHSPEIYRIEKISKKFPNSITIVIEPHKDTYVVSTPLQRLIAYQDGIVHEEMPVGSTSTPPGVEMGITLEQSPYIKIGDTLLDNGLRNDLNTIQHLLEKVQLPLTYFQLETNEPLDLVAYTAPSFKIITGRNPDSEKLKEKISTLLSQIQPGDQHNIFYIDLRLDTRAFVCFKNTPCIKDIPDPILPQATSTIDSLSTTTASTTLPTTLKP